MPKPVYRDPWFVYLIECKDSSLYCGVSNDVPKRIATHSKGKGAKYTKKRLPVTLMWVSDSLPNKSAAMKEEYRIKRLRKVEKLKLIFEHEDK